MKMIQEKADEVLLWSNRTGVIPNLKKCLMSMHEKVPCRNNTKKDI